MRNLLTRMAERAIGVRPVALPLTRPVFATPRQLRERVLEDAAQLETPRSAASAQDRGAPQPSGRSKEEYSEPGTLSRTQRLAQFQQLEHRRALEQDRNQAAVPGPTLPVLTFHDVLAHIYGAQNAGQHTHLAEPESVEPATRGASLLPLSRIEDETPQDKRDEKERQRASASIEPRVARVLPQSSVMQESKVFANSFANQFYASHIRVPSTPFGLAGRIGVSRRATIDIARLAGLRAPPHGRLAVHDGCCRCHASRPLSCQKRPRGRIRRKMRTTRTKRKSSKMPIFYDLRLE